MSSLLREAIVDAKALREAALKNAETVVIDKYSDEVRQTLEQLLEQDDLDLDLGMDPGGMGELDAGAADPMGMPLEEEAEDDIAEDLEDVPLGGTVDLAGMEGKNLKKIPGEGENIEVTLDLGALRESVEALQAEIEEDLEFSEYELIDMLAEDDAAAETQEAGEMADSDDEGEDSASETAAEVEEFKGLDEEIEISEEVIDDLVEKLTVDMGASLSGWAGRSSESVKWELQKALAQRRSTDVEDELDVMRKAQEELVFENKQLKEQLSQYERATHELKEGLQTVNLSNARLLYTNRVLRNASLNERQKKRIVEAISQAGSVTEAKTIYNTLESTVESRPNRRPRTLSEAINRPSSVIRASRKEVQNTDPFLDRMRKLAGIN